MHTERKNTMCLYIVVFVCMKYALNAKRESLLHVSTDHNVQMPNKKRTLAQARCECERQPDESI